MTDPSAFTKLVPGFDFLQGLVKNAGAALPGIGQWVAPTIDPAELEKRIEELRTVQFWLEQNARMLGATIQALEVQRMTLSTLKTMNVQMEDLRDALQVRLPTLATPAAAPAPAHAAPAAPAPGPAAAAPPAGATAGVVDPLQWWGALTQQFSQLAMQAMRDGTADAAKSMAGAVARQSIGAAGRTLKKAASMPVAVAQSAVRAASSASAAAPAARRKRGKAR